MNKSDLIRVVANNAGITIKEADDAVNAFIAAVLDGLKQGERIQVSGFGTFDVKQLLARDGFNPMTGEKIKIEASKLPVFKFGKTFKDEINK